MKQLTRHIIMVRFIDCFGNLDKVRHFNAADVAQSKECGRRVAEWLAKGERYRVESETDSIQRA